MNKLLFLHGNAGTNTDLKPLLETFKAGGTKFDEILAPNLYELPSLHKLLAGKDWTVVTHSWGAYYLLDQVEEIEHHLRKIIFINPYVVQESPLSTIAQLLVQAPVIGKSLLQTSHRKQKTTFLANMLAPETTSSVPYSGELAKNLENYVLWANAATNKIYQQSHPLPPHELTDVPAVAFIGGEDQVCNNDLQLQMLQTVAPNLTIRKINNAGHGLLWTHMNEISKETLS